MVARKKPLIKEYWDTLSPNHRRIAVIILTLCAFFIFMAVITEEEEGGRYKKVKAVERSVLTDSDTRSIGIDALNAKVKAVNKENDRLMQDMDRMQNELKDMRRRAGNDPDMTRELSVLKTQLKALTDKAKTIGWEVEDIKEGYYQVPPAGKRVAVKTPEGSGQPDPRQLLTENKSPPSAPEKKKVINIEDGLNSDPAYYFRTAPQRPDTPAPVAGAADLKTGAIDGGGLQIFTTESVRQQVVEASKDADTYLPAGSIISGVLLNGLDAPTGRNAKKDPFPVLVRIQKDAVLPNLFNVDVKECFATLSGYGEMSSERAYLRGEKLSCVTNEAEIIEQDFPAYGVGEDGKAGVRGRLVTKAGSLLAKTALAGFAAGVAEAFNTSPVPVIQTGTPGNDTLFQQNYSSDAVQHGVSKGASASLARLAEYYMDMADQIFPVVEVDASRQIDIVLTSGLRLKVKKLDTRKIARR